MQDKALNQADITNLQTQAAKYGGVSSDQFKNVVNTKYGAGAYDQLVKNTALGIQSGQVQGNTANANQLLKDAPAPLAPVPNELETAIKSGNFTASQAQQYNQMTGDNNAARNLMLSSQKAVSNPNVQTAITTNEAQTMKNEGIKSVNQNITRADNKVVTPNITNQPNGDNISNINGLNYNTDGSLKNGGQITQPETNKTVVTQNQTPTGTVTTTETPKETPTGEKILTIDQFKAKGANPANLEQFIEDRYGTTATQQDGGVVANINGENFKWTIDSAGNPIKTSLGKGVVTPSANLSITDYLNQLNAGQKIQANNPAAIEAQHIYDSVGKYKGASSDVLYSDMVSGKIVPGSDNYNHLLQMNGGVETPEMQQAKAKYQQKVKTDLINKNVDIQAGDYKEPVNPVQVASDNLVKTKGMDYALEFQKDIVNNPDIVNLSTELNDTNAQIKELEYAKRKTLDQIIKDHPGISMGMAIGIAQNQNGDIDDQLFGLYNKQATQQANLDYKTNLASKMFDYKVKQNEQNIADAQKELEYQRNLASTIEQRQYEAEQQAKQTAQAFQNQKELLALQQQYKDADIQTSVITDEATGKKSLINNQTGEVIKSYDTGLAPKEGITPYQQAQIDLEREKLKAANPSKNTTPTVTPSGNVETYQVGDKQVKMDSNAAQAFNTALQSMPGTIIGSTFRTKEEQQKLYDAYKAGTGGLAAAPGTSLHEKGLAVDIYGGQDKNGKLLPPTADQIKIMNANGWYQTAGYGDKGHFEFKGNTTNADALNTILGSGKFTKDQTASITNAINNGEDPFTVIKNQAKQLLSGANQTKIESYEQSRDSMKDLQSALDEYYKAGGNTNLLKGKYENVVNKLGEVDDPKLVDLAVQIQSALQIYRNAVSGTAYSVQEGADIASIFPGITKSQGLNNAVVNGRLKSMNSIIDNTYKSVLGNTYDKLKTQNTTPTSTNTQTTGGSPSVDKKDINALMNTYFSKP